MYRSDPRSSVPLAENVPVAGPRLEPFVQAVHAEELVGGMEVFVGRRKREEDGIEAHVTLEQLRYRYRAAHPHDDRLHAVGRVQRRAGGFQPEVIGTDVRGT